MSSLGGVKQSFTLGVPNKSWIGDDEILGPLPEETSVKDEGNKADATPSNRVREMLMNEELRAQWCFPALSHALIACVLTNLNFTMHIAFFPKTSEERGLNTIEIGAIFSIFQFSSLVTTLFMPKMLERYDPWVVLRNAIGPHAAVTGFFALANFIKGGGGFFTYSFIIRAMEGCLAAVIESSAAEVAKSSVPDEHLESSVSWLEIAKTVGILFGPVTGGGLRNISNFAIPIVFSASFFVLLFLAMSIPFERRSSPTTESMPREPIALLVKKPFVWVMALGIFVSCAAITFLEPTLQPLVSHPPYYYNEVQMGLLYSSLIVSYTISASIAEWIASRCGTLIPLTIGMVSTASGFFLISSPGDSYSPTPPKLLLEIDHSRYGLGYLVGGLCCMGVGVGLSLISSTLAIVDESEYHGISREGAFTVIPWIVTIVYTLGNSVGPFFGGILENSINFARATKVIGIILSCIYGIVILVHATVLYRRRSKEVPSTVVQDTADTQASPLLQSFNDLEPQITIH